MRVRQLARRVVCLLCVVAVCCPASHATLSKKDKKTGAKKNAKPEVHDMGDLVSYPFSFIYGCRHENRF